MDDTESRPQGAPGERWYAVLGGGRGCGHRHWSLVAAAVCLGRRRQRLAALGRMAWDLHVSGPGGAPLTAEEHDVISAWERREQSEVGDAAPAGAGVLRRAHELLREGLDAAAAKAIELASDLVEQQPEPSAQAIAARIREAAAELRADAVRFAALLPDAAERQRLERLAETRRKGPRRAPRWARGTAGSA